MAFVSQDQAAVAAEPGDGAFYDPAVAAESGRGFDAAPRDAVADASFAQGPVAVGDVVGLVGVEFRGFAAPGPALGPDLRNALDERLQGLGVVEVRGRDSQNKGQAVPVGEDVDLAARLAAIDRVWAGQ